MVAKANEALQAARAFTLTRLLKAPRKLVFRAFIEPDQMRHWWVPSGFTMLSCKLDLREGGAWRMRIKSDETGAIQTEVGVYREIREPERLSFTHAWVRANGTLTPTTLVTVRFIARRDGTEVSFHQEDFATAAACQSHADGWSTSLDKLTAYFGEGKP
jgi:uncharacterized protein YndB with AHSA1/START domain